MSCGWYTCTACHHLVPGVSSSQIALTGVIGDGITVVSNHLHQMLVLLISSFDCVSPLFYGLPVFREQNRTVLCRQLSFRDNEKLALSSDARVVPCVNVLSRCTCNMCEPRAHCSRTVVLYGMPRGPCILPYVGSVGIVVGK